MFAAPLDGDTRKQDRGRDSNANQSLYKRFHTNLMVTLHPAPSRRPQSPAAAAAAAPSDQHQINNFLTVLIKPPFYPPFQAIQAFVSAPGANSPGR
jgi:hypothetical protein